MNNLIRCLFLLTVCFWQPVPAFTSPEATRAIDATQQSLEMARKSKDRFLEWFALIRLANLYERDRRYKDAEVMLLEALKIAPSDDSKASTLLHLARNQRSRKLVALAKQYYFDTIEFIDALPKHRHFAHTQLAEASLELGAILVQERRYGQAKARLRRAMDHFQGDASHRDEYTASVKLYAQAVEHLPVENME